MPGAQEGHYSVVKTLIDMGADINYVSHGGQSALRATLLSFTPGVEEESRIRDVAEVSHMHCTG